MSHRVYPEVDVISGEPQDFALGIHRRYPVAVSEHGAPGLPGGAGGVLDLTEVVEPAVDCTEACRRTEEIRPGLPADRDDMPECRHLAPDAVDEGRPLHVGNDGHCSCVAESVENLVLLVDPVRRDRDGADTPEGEVGDEVLRRALQVDADTVPALDPEVDEAAPDPGDPVQEFGVGIRFVPGGDYEGEFSCDMGVGIEECCTVRHGWSPFGMDAL